MRLSIFVSTMRMQGDALIDRLQAEGLPVSFINQCDSAGEREMRGLKIFDINERGLSRSRNAALDRADGDLLWLCDDDLIFAPDCEKTILRAFSEHPDADALMFEVVCETEGRKNRPIGEEHTLAISNAMRYPTFQYVFRTEFLKKTGIRFDTRFGSGSEYSSGEDSLFTAALLRAGAKIIAVPLTVARVEHTDSAWFRGFDEKYRHDKGALFRCLFGRKYLPYCALMLYRHKEWRGGKSFLSALGDMRKGAKSLK